VSDALVAASKRLAAARARQRRQKAGPPLNQDEAALDALSTVSSADLPAVESFIRDAAGQLGVDLFRAKRSTE
jgi:hypothetical protein